jgi:hypothetical protein
VATRKDLCRQLKGGGMEIIMKNKILWIGILTMLSFCGCGKENQVTENNTTVDGKNMQKIEESMQGGATLSDISPVTSMEQLWEISDCAVKAKVLSRTERTAGYNQYIDYTIEVNEWIKGERTDTKELLLTVYNNENGIYMSEERYYDFDLNENYIFFMIYDEGRDFYWLSNQNTGLIKVEDDNHVKVDEHDLIFKKCKTYDDVLEIIDKQK